MVSIGSINGDWVGLTAERESKLLETVVYQRKASLKGYTREGWGKGREMNEEINEGFCLEVNDCDCPIVNDHSRSLFHASDVENERSSLIYS